MASQVAVRNSLALFTLLAVGACASGPQHDQAGNVYPFACRGELSGGTIVRVPANDPRITVVVTRPHTHALATRWPDGTIYVSDNLTGWRYDDAVRHERCHALLGAWH